MLVKDFMSVNVVTVSEDQSMLEARELLLSNNILSLPVVDDMQRVRGMITLDDVGKASPSAGSTLSKYEANYLLGRLKVKDVMSRNTISVNADDTIEYIAYQVFKTKHNAFPVVDINNRLCGIIAQNDMLRGFVEAFGLNHDCTRLTLEVNDEAGVLEAICKIFHDNNVNIISVLVRNGYKPGKSQIILRAGLEGRMDVIEQLREAGYEVNDVMTFRGLE